MWIEKFNIKRRKFFFVIFQSFPLKIIIIFILFREYNPKKSARRNHTKPMGGKLFPKVGKLIFMKIYTSESLHHQYQGELNRRRGRYGFRTLCCDGFGLLKN